MPRRRAATSRTASAANRPGLEYLAAALGALFALTIIVIIAWHWTQASGKPPDIQVETVDVFAASSGFAVRFRAANRGGMTASEVRIQGTSGDETAVVVFDHLPGGAEREGTLVFTKSPDRASIQWRVISYRDP